VESKLGPHGTSATSGLLYLSRVIMKMKNLVEWRLVEETEVLRENLPLAPLCPPQIPLDHTRTKKNLYTNFIKFNQEKDRA
jgi:hypothetical protein